MYHRYMDVAPYSHPVESPHSFSTVSNPAGSPENATRQVREVKSYETTSTGRTVSSSRDYEAITVKDHAPALTLAPGPAASADGIGPSWTTSRTTRSGSSPAVFALGISSTPSTWHKEATASQQLTEIPAVPFSTGHESTVSTAQQSFSSEQAPTQSATASSVNIGSARTTGIIIGSVLGGSAALLMVSLAAIYVAWRRRQRRRRRDQAGREDHPGPDRSEEEPGAGTGGNTATEERKKRPAESTTGLPLQGAAALPPPRTLRSEPTIVDAISPVTPTLPHLSRWASEKAGIPSPAGHHPAIDTGIPPHMRGHPLFASTHYDDDDDDDGHDDDGYGFGPHEYDHARPISAGDVSPCSSSPPFPYGSSPPEPPSPVGAAAGDAARGGFLFFPSDSPSPRSSTTRRPSTRDSSAPPTALSMPPRPRRRHTRASGQGGGDGGGPASSRRGSGSSAGGGLCSFNGGGDGRGAHGGVASFPRPPSPPPPLPGRSAARSKSLHDVERPATWI